MNHQLHSSMSGFKKHLHLESRKERGRVLDKHEISLIPLELATERGNCLALKNYIPYLKVFLPRNDHYCSNMYTKVLTIATNCISNYRVFINILSHTYHIPFNNL